MIHRPEFRPHLHVAVVAGEGVFLASEDGHTILRGELFERLAPLIDGRRTAQQIAELLALNNGDRSTHSGAAAYYALDLLEKAGHIVESDEGRLPAGMSALFSLGGVSPTEAASRLETVTVSITAFDGLSPQPLASLLESHGLRSADDCDFGVVLARDYLQPELEVYNRRAIERSQPWLLLKSHGAEVWIGPIFRPGQTGCWACLAHRLRYNRAVDVFVQRRQQRDHPLPLYRARTPATEMVVHGLASTAIATWVARGELPELEGRIVSLDLRAWKMQSHTLIRQPYCPVCGNPGAASEHATRAIELASDKKIYTVDGGHRSTSPEDTLRRYEQHISPITGAVASLEAAMPGGDGPLHVFLSGYNFAVYYENLRSLQHGLRSRSSGKGMTDVQARASGLCEAIERYSGCFQGYEPRRRASFVDLADLAIHPNACMGFSQRQYEQRARGNAGISSLNQVPLPFDERAEIEWTPLWSLTRQAMLYLPTEYCYYGYHAPPERHYCPSGSNGCAAGNTLEEAILQGFLELVERDAIALWWYNRVQRPAVDLDSVEEPYLYHLRAYLTQRGRELWALDLTADLGIPTFVALVRRKHAEEQIMMGFGAHLDARIALLRAVTEANQMLVWVLRDGAGGEIPRLNLADEETLTWLRTARLSDHAYLLPEPGSPARRLADFPSLWSDDLKDDISYCQSLVEQRGMDMLVLDQTRPDIGLPVARVVVPGLRHHHARFAPGRLYDIPVAMGWLDRPLLEEELNPIPMFL